MEKYQYDAAEFKILEESSIPFAVYQLVDGKVVTLALSEGFLKQFGYDDKAAAYELMDNDMYRDCHPEDREETEQAAVTFATVGDDYSVVYRTKIRGEYHVIHAHGKHILKDGTRLAVVWYSDEGPYIPEESGLEGGARPYLSRHITEKNLVHKVNYDHLTGLPSMFYFFMLAEAGRNRYLAEGSDPAMLFIDLNGMKRYNRKYGIEEGDNLIREVAKLLSDHFARENCARLGGDHFAVFTRAEGLPEILKKLLNEAKEINEGRNLPIRIGVYLNSIENVGAGSACDRAKMACDHDKNIYTSYYSYYDEEMLRLSEKRQYIVENLDKALKEGWIKVYYQPIIRAANGKVCDEEALARWIDPEKGFMSPADFIPILEDARLIYLLDLYMLEKVLEKLEFQKEHGLYLVPQSVNLSRTDFDVCDMVEEIRRRVDEGGVDRSLITIEITESTIGNDLDYMKGQIRRFQELGFEVWMDDYGSGYSSPDLLQQIHFDVLKLDMVFMRQFDKGENSRIILTELVRMAQALGIETVVEGVETQEQVEFLTEIGAAKLQGFYFCKPIPPEEIVERHKKGQQIGFENPEESEYYTALGRVNLYDLSLSSEDEPGFKNYFNTMPMVLLEVNETEQKVIRGNRPHREFIKNHFSILKGKQIVKFEDYRTGPGSDFMQASKQCARDGKRVILDERTPEGDVIHLFLRRIAVNPVTKVSALAVVVLGFAEKDDENRALNFTLVAKALSSDYAYLYCVNLDTEKFVEYSPNEVNENLSVERHGDHFFAASREDALKIIHEEDRNGFILAFTKENVIKSMEENGSFSISYRLIIHKDPVWMNLKAVRLQGKRNDIIIGVSNVDAQMKIREEFERVKEERVIYSRISALSGEYIIVYAVDPETEAYIEYSSTEAYGNLGLMKVGEHFFERGIEMGKNFILEEDLPNFLEDFSRENVEKKMLENGAYTLNVRLKLRGEAVWCCIKVVTVVEQGSPKYLVGITNIDAQVKREQEQARKLLAARNEANIDTLTGVKNRHAFVDMDEHLNRMIEEGNSPDFAIVVFDINGLKAVNDSRGLEAGDEHIREGCLLVCRLFSHSPVFRLNGGTFVVVAEGSDYEKLDLLMMDFRELNRRNLEDGNVVMAVGYARYEDDRNVTGVFERADASMLQNKKELKAHF